MRNIPSRLEISPKTVLWFVVIFFGGWLLIQIRDILVLLFIAFITMSALRPSVEKLHNYGIPRFAAIISMYLLLVGVMVGFGTVVLPPLIHETLRFINILPTLLKQITPLFNFNVETLIQQVAPIGQNVIKVTVGLFSNLVTIFTIAVFTFYFLMERNNLKQLLEGFIGIEMGDKIIVIVRKIEERLGSWVRGQLLLAIIIGSFSLVGLSLMGVPYALPLALIAGILEVVPIIGPIISAIPAVLVSLTISPWLAVLVVALYFVIQQLENNFIVPTVMQKTVGLPPLASLLALMIGGKLAGVTGIILSVPLLLMIQTVLQNILTRNSAD